MTQFHEMRFHNSKSRKIAGWAAGRVHKILHHASFATFPLPCLHRAGMVRRAFVHAGSGNMDRPRPHRVDLLWRGGGQAAGAYRRGRAGARRHLCRLRVVPEPGRTTHRLANGHTPPCAARAHGARRFSHTHRSTHGGAVSTPGTANFLLNAIGLAAHGPLMRARAALFCFQEYFHVRKPHSPAFCRPFPISLLPCNFCRSANFRFSVQRAGDSHRERRSADLLANANPHHDRRCDAGTDRAFDQRHRWGGCAQVPAQPAGAQALYR